MYPSEDKNTKGNLLAAIAAAIYLALLALLLLTVYFTLDFPPQDAQIVVDLGGAAGAGAAQTGGRPSSEPSAGRQPAVSAQASVQPTLTQEHEPAPAVKPQANHTRRTTDPTTASTATETPRQVDQNSLFRNPTTSATSSSVASAGGGRGTVGPNGGTDSSDKGSGSGISGIFELKGRGLVGVLPKPDYSAKKDGKVVVTIVVDRNGAVVSAEFSPKGSTLQDPQLVDEAKKAARKARFTTSEGADNQMGTITYKFNLT